MNIPAVVESASDDFESVSVDDLFSGDTLNTLVHRVAARMNTANLVASAALFQKRYTSQLLATVLSPMTTIGLGVLADLSSTKIKLVDDLPAGVVLKENCEVVVIPERFQTEHLDVFCSEWKVAGNQKQLRDLVFSALFSQNQFPLMEHISQTFGLSPKVMWGNIGNYTGYLYDLLDKQSHIRSVADEDRKALHGLVFADQPLSKTYRMVKLEQDELDHHTRVRTSCCLWYQLAGSCDKACVTCPLISQSQRVAKLFNK